MSKTTIAPQLTALLKVSSIHTARGGTIGRREARAELETLKACARELQAIKKARGHEDDCMCSMCECLARLSRGSPRRRM